MSRRRRGLRRDGFLDPARLLLVYPVCCNLNSPDILSRALLRGLLRTKKTICVYIPGMLYVLYRAPSGKPVTTQLLQWLACICRQCTTLGVRNFVFGGAISREGLFAV